MTLMDERFLLSLGSKYRIDSRLPLRIQKRQLLGALGFPGNPDLKTCRARSSRTLKRLWAEYSTEGLPFLIVVSEKPMKTLVPPLFVVRGENSIEWRNDRGVLQEIGKSRVFKEIARYGPSTWVEFTPYIWGEQVFAGRVLYESTGRQILEVQEETIPSRIMNDRELPVFSGEIRFLDLDRLSYLASVRRLESIGYKYVLHFGTVRFVCKALQPYRAGFEKLLGIAKHPTFEFALDKSGRMTSIDIDWPAQWINKGGMK